MSTYLLHRILSNTFLLSSNRCMFWEETKTLILSDLHLGKIGHFRKAGIALPTAIFKEDMQRLFTLFQHFKPLQVVIIGDMFHSESNKEHDFFLKWRQDFNHIPIHLVKGNHDILAASWYALANITIHIGALKMGEFIFVHDANDSPETQNSYVFSGHVHPSITIKGRGRQTLKFPCFYFGKKGGILPAFGKFTGTHCLEPKAGENVFALVEQTIIAL